VVGWISWLIEAVAVAAGLVLAPIYAIVMFATHHAAAGWKSMGLFAVCLLYGLLLAHDVIKRPWARD
jgi:hypothetical protein